MSENKNIEFTDVELLNLKSLDVYFELLKKHFQQASEKLEGPYSFNFQLANKNLKITSAGEKFLNIVSQSFIHLELNGADLKEKTFNIFIWDEYESGISLPNPPWLSSENMSEDRYIQFQLDQYFAYQFHNQSILYLYNVNENSAFCIVKDARNLINSFIAAPFIKLISFWASKHNLNILHAGCVSLNDNGVLIVGRGGKGKSSTSIQCIIDGLDYLSDDYLLIEDTSEKTIAYSIYNSGHLELNNIENFPKIKTFIEIGNIDQNNKPYLFLSPIFKDKVKPSTEIKAIIVPLVTKNKSASFYPISPIESLKALAPTSLVQLNTRGINSLNSLANLTKKFPNYCLELGSNFEDISVKVKKIIQELSVTH
jgi:hypothetical protein